MQAESQLSSTVENRAESQLNTAAQSDSVISEQKVDMTCVGARGLGWALLLAAVSQVALDQNAVTVTVYYGSFCQNCADFISEQLYPTYLAIGLKQMQVELVPYGNTQRTQQEGGGWSLVCTQGPKECLTNKLQACGIHVFSDYSRVCFVRCTMFSPYAGPQCVTSISPKDSVADDTELANCVNSVQGDYLLDGHGRHTRELQLQLTSLPVVTFDGDYREEEQAEARVNLLKVVCARLSRKSRPAVCEEARANQTMTHRNFDTEYFYPHSNVRCATKT